MARVYETVTVLCLLGTLVLGITYVLSALIDYQKSSLHTLLSKPIKILTALTNYADHNKPSFFSRLMELLFTLPLLLRLFRRSCYVIA